MTADYFELRKERLIDRISKRTLTLKTTSEEATSLKKLLEVIRRYQYETRLEQKGIIERVVVDCLELDYSIGRRQLSLTMQYIKS